MTKEKGFGSICSHPIENGKIKTHAHLEPIFATSTFVFDSAEAGMKAFTGEDPTHIYSRWSNPTTAVTERKIAALEGYKIKNKVGKNIHPKAWLCSSGMGAISTLFLSVLKSGEKILSQASLYGGTAQLFNNVLPNFKIDTVTVDLKNLDAVEQALKNDPSIQILYAETPANPTNECYDLAELGKLAAKYKVWFAVDNTYSTPYLQQPFKFGAHFIVHSTTKYLNGHGTAIGGVLVANVEKEMEAKVYSAFKLLGANSNPFDAWLVNLGIKTLELRMDRHCDNAMKVAEFLEQHPAISKVNYTGLPSHPDHELAQKQMRDFGGMVSFELAGGLDAGISLMNNIKFCTLAVSLGTVDTLIQHPASMTHTGVSKKVRESYGLTDGLIRMSVGIENVEDIIEDLEQALDQFK